LLCALAASELDTKKMTSANMSLANFTMESTFLYTFQR
jgi:hypothetical protein